MSCPSRGRTKLVAAAAVVVLTLAACSRSGDADFVANFRLCPVKVYESSDVPAERRQEIMDQARAIGIAGGGSLGEDGPVELALFVLDEASLEALATIAEADEVCVTGQDPADYVEPGPQSSAGPGWRWLGAAEVAWSSGRDPDLITDTDELGVLWSTMFPEENGSPPAVDFGSESVLVLQTQNGITPGPCGFRFEGITRTDSGMVVAQMFTPGGLSVCPTIAIDGTYAVAIEHAAVGEPPFDFAIQFGPREDPELLGTLG